MANICMYRAKLKGKQENCEAFCYMLPTLEGGVTIEQFEEFDDGNVQMIIEGYCNWSIYADTKERRKVDQLSDEEIREIAETGNVEKYYDYPVNEKTKLCGVNMWIVYADIDNFTKTEFEHYNCGKNIDHHIADSYETLFNRTERELGKPIIAKVMTEASRVIVPKKGYQFCLGIYEKGDIVIIDTEDGPTWGVVDEVEFTKKKIFGEIKEAVGKIEKVKDKELTLLWKLLSKQERETVIDYLVNNKYSSKSVASKWRDLAIAPLWYEKQYEDSMIWPDFLSYLGELSGHEGNIKEELKSLKKSSTKKKK